MENKQAVEKTTGRLRQPRPKWSRQQPSNASAMHVGEPEVAYGVFTKKDSLLSLSLDAPENQLSSFEKISLIDDGISKKQLERLKDFIGWDYNQLADILGVARAKLLAKKGNERFDKHASESIINIADLYAYGYEVFEDKSRFNAWIFRPNRALGGLAPFDLLDTHYGREEIKNLIGRIDYGVYS